MTSTPNKYLLSLVCFTGGTESKGEALQVLYRNGDDYRAELHKRLDAAIDIAEERYLKTVSVKNEVL